MPTGHDEATQEQGAEYVAEEEGLGRVKLRSSIKMMLLKHNYPIEGASGAADLILSRVALKEGLGVSGV